jgi:hypothetical protein
LTTVPAYGDGISTTALAVSDLDDRLVEGDGVALGDQPAHHLTVGEPFAEVGKLELALGHLDVASS